MYKVGTKLGAKLGANYITICAIFRKWMQKTPKIAPTHEIAPFVQKMKKNTLKDGLDAKRMQKEILNPVFVVVTSGHAHIMLPV